MCYAEGRIVTSWDHTITVASFVQNLFAAVSNIFGGKIEFLTYQKLHPFMEDTGTSKVGVTKITGSNIKALKGITKMK